MVRQRPVKPKSVGSNPTLRAMRESITLDRSPPKVLVRRNRIAVIHPFTSLAVVEACPSGLWCRFRKSVWGDTHRRFESCRFRQRDEVLWLHRAFGALWSEFDSPHPDHTEIVQLVERLALNQVVVGSTPTLGATSIEVNLTRAWTVLRRQASEGMMWVSQESGAP